MIDAPAYESDLRRVMTDFVVAVISGVTCKMFAAPMECAYEKILADDIQYLLGKSFPQPTYQQIFRKMIEITRKDGILSLYSSSLTRTIKYLHHQTLNFVMHDWIKRNSSILYQKHLPYSHFVIGGIAGVISFLPNTFKFAKSSIQFKRMSSEKIIYKYLSKSAFPTFCVFIYRSIYFGGYYMVKEMLPSDTHFLRMMVVGWISYSAAHTIAYPLRMIDSKRAHDLVIDSQLQRLKRSIKLLYSQGGIKQFFKGSSSIMKIICIANGTMLAVYDYLQKYMA